jgi:hypothetical protein
MPQLDQSTTLGKFGEAAMLLGRAGKENKIMGLRFYLLAAVALAAFVSAAVIAVAPSWSVDVVDALGVHGTV